MEGTGDRIVRHYAPFNETMRVLTAKVDFRRRYRMSCVAFRSLLAQALPVFVSFFNEAEDVKERARNVAPRALAIMLRIFAGGAMLDVQEGHAVGHDYGYTLFWRMLASVDGVLRLQPFWQNLEERSEAFAARTGGIMSGCVGCLDGLLVRIVKPSVANSAYYYCRKGFHCYNIQAVCDHRYRFTFFSARAAGSTHDATAFAMSDLSPRVHELGNYWIACDAAYPLGPNLIVPFKGKQLTTRKDSFNFYLSSIRIKIECAFGIMGNRFPLITHVIKLVSSFFSFKQPF